MNALAALLRRHAAILVLLVFAAYFAFAAYVNGDRLTALCNAFGAEDTLVRRAVPETSPWKAEIDTHRQTIASLCETHFAERKYPEPKGD